VAIFTCPVDALQTETKGTVLIKTAEELTNYTRGEETQLENMIKVRPSINVLNKPPLILPRF
jgi:T-complex protein 1 subunit theta